MNPEHMKMEIVEGLVACVEGSVIQRATIEPSISSSNSKRIKQG